MIRRTLSMLAAALAVAPTMVPAQTTGAGTAPEVMTNAAIRLLDLSTQDIRKQAEEIIFGQLRQVIASMKITDIRATKPAALVATEKNAVTGVGAPS
mgnify:CR=1 FL=1